MFKVVFDTNVLISGVLHAGKSRMLIDAVLDGKILLILSIQIIRELKRVIARDKFKLSRNQQKMLTNFVLMISHIVKLRSRFKVVGEDPSDDMILRTAYDGGAQYIVSGDEHLLSLREFKGVKILTVSEMLELVKITASSF
jgi:putative PIN family toxin of toxin-antitoxin system